MDYATEYATETCPDCKGSKRYQGLFEAEDCQRCRGSGVVPLVPRIDLAADQGSDSGQLVITLETGGTVKPLGDRTLELFPVTIAADEVAFLKREIVSRRRWDVFARYRNIGIEVALGVCIVLSVSIDYVDQRGRIKLLHA